METTTGAAVPLLVSDDDALVADVRRLAAAAGVAPTVVSEPLEALQGWSRASAVLVGEDSAERVAAVRPPRRGRVEVVCRGEPATDTFRHAVLLGAEEVAVLPASDAWLVELLSDTADGTRHAATVVGVIGGAGGVGASIFACALAQTAAERCSVLLVDADPLGAGVDRILGLDEGGGVGWDALTTVGGRLSARALRDSLPRRDALSVLAFGAARPEMPSGPAMREVLSAGARGFDLVVVDLPRWADGRHDEVLTACDRLVLVSTLTVAAVTAASRVRARLPGGVPAGLVARASSSSVAPDHAGRLLGLPVLCSMADQRGLDESIDLGAGPLRIRRGPLGRAAMQVVPQLLGTAEPW